MCLYHLRMHPDGLTASELCRQTLDDKAAISRAIAQLREGGYVIGDAGRHNIAVTLTEKGERLAQYVTVRAARAVAAAVPIFRKNSARCFIGPFWRFAATSNTIIAICCGSRQTHRRRYDQNFGGFRMRSGTE